MSPESPVHPPELDQIGHVGHARGRLVAIALVLTTLAAATTGYVQAAAIRVHDEADIRAERLGALAVGAGVADQEQAAIQVERYRTAQTGRLQAAGARQAAIGAHGDAARHEAKRWQWIADKTANDTAAIARRQQLDVECSAPAAGCRSRDVSVACAKGDEHCEPGIGEEAEAQRSAVESYEQQGQWERFRLNAKQKAANAEADGAQSRFAHLAAALTMLTVAVFLFGFSLTPQGKERRALFLTCAMFFAAAGAGWSAYHSLQGYPRPPDASANAFANGEVALEQENLKTAVTELTRATQLWPGFSAAYSDLAIAEYEQSARETGKGTVPPAQVLRKAVADDERALATGSESPTVTFDLGADLLFLGVETGNSAELQRARRLSVDVAHTFMLQLKDGRHPDFDLLGAEFSVAEADVALGRPAARAENCAAIATMINLSREVPPRYVVSAARAGIGLIDKELPSRRSEADRLLHDVEAAARTNSIGPCAAGVVPAVVAQHSAPAALLSSSHAH